MLKYFRNQAISIKTASRLYQQVNDLNRADRNGRCRSRSKCMNSFVFKPLISEDITQYLGKMFDILYDNMSVIAPSGNTYEEDYEHWSECVAPALKYGRRKVILIFFENELCGFFQYALRDAVFRMDEIQFKSEFKGSGLFEELYRYLTAIIPPETKYTEAFAHKGNLKSQGVLKHLGLQEVGESENGRCIHFRGEYKALLKRYS